MLVARQRITTSETAAQSHRPPKQHSVALTIVRPIATDAFSCAQLWTVYYEGSPFTRLSGFLLRLLRARHWFCESAFGWTSDI